MSKELIVSLRGAAASRVASTAMIGADDLIAAADALEQIDAAYASAVEAGKSLAQQALKAEQERDCAVRALTRAGHMLAEGAAEWKPPIGPAATPLLDKIDKISADRDALAAKLAAANSFYARDIGIRDKEISVLREKTMARFANDDCWIFQGDGNDHLESLVCPVAIMPAVLSAIIKERDALAAELKSLREQEPPADIDPHDAMLQKQHDEAQGPLANAAHKVYFRAGLLACREHMARFVESQDPSIAASIRANWWPDLGPDMGPPRRIEWGELTEGEYGESGFRVKEPHEISPTIEALPIALGFLMPDERTTK